MAIPAGPNLKCMVTAPGGAPVDLSKNLCYEGSHNQITFTQNFGRQGDTGTAVLLDGNYWSPGQPGAPSPSFVVPTASVITIVDQNPAVQAQPAGGVIFAGLVSDPTWCFNSPSEAEWVLQCVDFTSYADDGIVQGQFAGLSMDQVIVLLTQQANCGITAARVADGGFVYPGPTLPLIKFPFQALSKAWQTISQQASSSGGAYGWFVDQNLELHYYDQNQAPASGVTVTDTPTTAGLLSVSECHIAWDNQFTYEYDGSSLFNRALVQGATTTTTPKTTGAPTDAWVGDGVQASWPLSFVPDASSVVPTLVIGFSPQSVSISSSGTAPTTPFAIVQAPNGTWTLQVIGAAGGFVPGPGTVISLWYPYVTTVTAQADLAASQAMFDGPNGGVFAVAISDTTLTTVAAAFLRAQRELGEYGYPQERIVFNTSPEWIGWFTAGQTFELNSIFIPNSQNNFTPGLNAPFLVTQMQTTIGTGGYRTNQVTAVRVG